MRKRTKRNGLVETHRGFEAEDSMLCPVQRACRAYFEAHAAVVALNGPEGGSGMESVAPDGALLAAARDRRDVCLTVVRSVPARTTRAIRAKMDVLFALQDWWGFENVLVAQFAFEILRDAAPFFLPDAGEEPKLVLNGSVVGEGRHQWFDRLPRLLWFAHERREGIHTNVRRSQT